MLIKISLSRAISRCCHQRLAQAHMLLFFREPDDREKKITPAPTDPRVPLRCVHCQEGSLALDLEMLCVHKQVLLLPIPTLCYAVTCHARNTGFHLPMFNFNSLEKKSTSLQTWIIRPSVKLPVVG